MSKIIVTLVLGLILAGCSDQANRQKYLEKTYPKCKVEPATGLIQNSGYDFIIIDSTNQIIAVDFYLFSESKISNLRNIR